MAETSQPWSGVVTGDASIAPYDHLEFTKMYNKFFTSDGTGYAIPGYANSLNVQASSPGAATVDILSGAALVQGFLYENTALNTLAISANATGNPRIDRVVVRIDFTSQTARLAVLAGTAAASPVLPALTQNYGVTWEISLAYIWVANGFATITDAVIHDERKFQPTSESFYGQSSRTNLIRGSELIPKIAITSNGFMVISGTWFAMGAAAPTIAYVTKPTQQRRGNGVSVTAPGGNATTVYQLLAVEPSTVYTLRGLLKSVASGDLSIDIYGHGSAAALISRTIHIANTFVDETIRFTTGAADTTILIRMTVAATKVFHFGQIVLVEGYHAGEYLPVRELIMFPSAAFDANWNFTAKSTSNTDIDLATTAWGNLAAFNARDDIQSIVVVIGANDSGSAAAANAASVLGANMNSGATGVPGMPVLIDLAGEVNDRRKYVSGIVPVKPPVSGPTNLASIILGFRIAVVATGVSTLDAFFGIVGVYT